MRYYSLAAADARAAPDVLDDELLGPTGRPVSAPLLPLEPGSAPPDRWCASIVLDRRGCSVLDIGSNMCAVRAGIVVRISTPGFVTASRR